MMTVDLVDPEHAISLSFTLQVFKTLAIASAQDARHGRRGIAIQEFQYSARCTDSVADGFGTKDQRPRTGPSDRYGSVPK